MLEPFPSPGGGVGALPPTLSYCIVLYRIVHVCRKFAKCNCNPLIRNSLHLHELVNGIASVHRVPVSSDSCTRAFRISDFLDVHWGPPEAPGGRF